MRTAGLGEAMAHAGPVTVRAIQYADPWSVWSWGLEPVLRRLEEVYGPALSIETRLGGAIDQLGEWRRRMELEGPALREWLRAAMARTGNPVDPDCLTKGLLTTSFDACRAVKAAQLLAPEKAPIYLRRLMEYFQVRSLPADSRILKHAAQEVGLAASELEKEWASVRVREAFLRDRSEMHRSRRTFLEVEYRRTDGKAAVVNGEFRSRAHEEAIDRLIPGMAKRRPEGVEAYIRRRSGLIPRREVAEVFGLSDSDAEKELERLWSQGLLERWTYGGATFWTLVKPRSS